MIAVPRRCDVVVLGAGPAGLATAWYAVRRGFSVVVIDRAPLVGGLAGSLTVHGQSVDLGSHRLHPSIRPDILRDLGGLPGLDLQWRTRNGRIRLGGRWLGFPLRPTDLLRNAPPPFAAGVLGDMIRSSGRRQVQRLLRRAPTPPALPDSFAAQVRHHLGPTIARAFYEPYARKLWAVEADGLSAELFGRRVSAGTALAIVRRALHRGPPQGFWYPANGFGTISSCMATAVARGAGTILTSTPVASITPGPDDHPVVRLRDGREIAARTVVSTIPSGGLLTMIDAPTQVRAAAAGLTFRAAVLVYLTVPQTSYTPYDAHYFPEPATSISRLSEPKNYRTCPADPTDRTVLCAELPATEGDRLWQAEDNALIRQVGRELTAQGLPDPAPLDGRVERRTHVYPVYRTGFEEQRSIVDNFDLGPNLAVLGRQALFAHDNTHHALLMAKSVIDALTDDARLDRDRWATARRTFADHVVED